MRPRAPRLRVLGNRIRTLDTRTAKPPPKVREDIYVSPEYQAWRGKVIGRAGGRCETELPDGSTCGRAEERMYADHVVELQDGGAPFDVENGICRCGSCHTVKTNAVRAARHQAGG